MPPARHGKHSDRARRRHRHPASSATSRWLSYRPLRMRPVAAGRAEAQSFDRIAADRDRLIELNGRKGAEPADRWLHGLLPAAGRRALDLGCGTWHHAMLPAERSEHADAIDIRIHDRPGTG
jgi:hypothetical protein